MDSKQLYTILNSDDLVKDLNFVGVFPIDMIAISALKFPCAMVINTKPHYHKGEHWVAVVKTEERNRFYFDSFGYPPYIMPEIGDVLENCTEWQFNEVKLQSNISTVWGEHVTFFITHMARGFTLEHITYMLNNEGDLYTNDAVVFNYIKNKYQDTLNANTKSLKIIDFPFVLSQLSSVLQ